MKIKEDYDTWSKTYDQEENKTRDLEKSAGQCILEPLKFKDVLELGCGTGKNTAWIHKQAKNIIAVDFSPKMLEIARKNISSKNVKFIEADINNTWSFISSPADLITCSLILEHVKDLNFIFSQAHKNLSSAGILYICELHPFKQYEGSKASFKTGGKLIDLITFVHHISDYTGAAESNNFKLINLKEWFDDDNKNKIPRLISFIFEKVTL